MENKYSINEFFEAFKSLIPEEPYSSIRIDIHKDFSGVVSVVNRDGSKKRLDYTTTSSLDGLKFWLKTLLETNYKIAFLKELKNCSQFGNIPICEVDGCLERSTDFVIKKGEPYFLCRNDFKLFQRINNNDY